MTRVVTQSASDAEAVVDQLKRWLADREVGSMRPIEVEAHQDEDADEDLAWYFVIRVPVPPGAETWSVDDIVSLSRDFGDQAIHLGLQWPWYLRLRPDEEDEESADEDDDATDRQ